MHNPSNAYDAAGWPGTHEHCPVFRTTGEHIRVWGLDDGGGEIDWRVVLPGEHEMAGIVRGYDVCLECSDGVATNMADRRVMAVSWPNIQGVRVRVAPAQLDLWTANGTDPAEALAAMARDVAGSAWLRVLSLTHDGESAELKRLAAEGADEEGQFKQILEDIDNGRWTFSA